MKRIIIALILATILTSTLLPTAVSVASSNPEHASRLAGYLHSDCFRAYSSDDIIGLQIGGAAKNVIDLAESL